MTTSTQRDPTIDVLRGLTIAAVTAYHLHVDVRGIDPGDAPAREFLAALSADDVRGLLGAAAHTLVAAPAFRLDLFLFVTGVVLMWAPPSSCAGAPATCSPTTGWEACWSRRCWCSSRRCAPPSRTRRLERKCTSARGWRARRIDSKCSTWRGRSRWSAVSRTHALSRWSRRRCGT